MSKQKKKQNNILVKSDVKKKKKRKPVPGFVSKATDRVKTLLTSPDSALTEINIKTFVNEETLQKLPSYLQYKLVTLLPKCDQHIHDDGSLKLSDEAFTNEFFTKACEEWRGKLAEGCFTDDRLQHMNIERSRQQATDAWKIKYFESTVPPGLLENCTPTSSNQSTSSPVPSKIISPPRKRKLEAEEEISNAGSSCRKRTKTNPASKAASKSGSSNDVSEKKKKEEQVATNWKNGSNSKEKESKTKKPTVTKKLTKTSGIKKTRPLRNRTPKAVKKVDLDSAETTKSTKSKVVKKVEDVEGNSHNGVSIKSKILNHLTNKLVKCDKQSSLAAHNEVVTPVEQGQVLTNSGNGTLTLSDLISREFELVCNSKEMAPTTLKFEHLKVGFISHKMFQSPVSSNVSSPMSSSMLPQFWKLSDSKEDPKLACSSTNSDQYHSDITSQSLLSNPDKDFKQLHPVSPAAKEDRPLAEYFPLLSHSLKNSNNKPVEPTIVQLRTMSSRRRNSNSVERETLLCLANKLSQKLFNKINLSMSLPTVENSHAVVTSKTSEPMQVSSPGMEFSANLDPKADSSLKCTVTKQNSTSANFNLLKNILLSVSTRSSFPISSQSMTASTPANRRPTSTASQIGCFGQFSKTSTPKPLFMTCKSRECAVDDGDDDDDDDKHNDSHISVSSSNSGSRSSSSNGSVMEDLSQLASPSQISCSGWQSSTKLPLPSMHANLVEQRNRSSKLFTYSNNSDLIEFVPKTLITQNRGKTNKPVSSLQIKDLAPMSKTSLQISIPSKKSLQNIYIASPKVHPSTFKSSTLQNLSSASTNSGNPSLGINSLIDCNNVDDAVVHPKFILNERRLCRMPQNVISQASTTTQFPLVQGDKLINFQLSAPSSNLFLSNVGNNIGNGNDNMKSGNASFQLPRTSLVPSPHCNQISSFQTQNNFSMSNSTSPVIIISPVNQQQLNLGPYMTVNNMSSEGLLNRSCKKTEIPSNNIFQMNQIVVSPPNYLPLLNIPQGSVIPQISPTMSKNQIVLLQNPPLASPMSSRSFAMTSDLSNNNGLKNVTFIPVVNTSTNNNQMFFLLSPKASNQK